MSQVPMLKFVVLSDLHLAAPGVPVNGLDTGARLAAAVDTINTPAVKEKLADQGLTLAPQTPEEFRALIAASRSWVRASCSRWGWRSTISISLSPSRNCPTGVPISKVREACAIA